MGSFTQAQPGPSISRKKPRNKVQRPKFNASKSKKVSTRQKLGELERDAMDYEAREDLQNFSDLPISDPTRRGLKKAFFVKMTDIQAKSLPVSLKGKDVLASARTGSGKTLAFLIPVLELLYRRKWGPNDGLGALIISPTRELAVQIFEVLRSIGGLHSFSAGLVIGGKNLKDESERLSRMNILVATPGRLLQHLDQTIGFEVDNLQMLVLDEADRILDMGFQRTLSALISHLPKSRQTLLFSATQTRSVSDLARLSLNDPVSIGLDETESSEMPQHLEQHYTICALDKKLDLLWGFIKTHLQCKVLVFMSSCKQVRFVFETFCKMHPGISLLHLHGKQKQSARIAMYTKFTTSSHAVLFATDIAARGLDFPAVDWVLQLDAPEDAETYIHRVGRTARYESKGKALMFLLPSEEEGMKAALKRKSIEVQNIKVRASKTQSIENQLQNLAFQDPELKYLGQRAFVSYLRSIYLHKDKSIFKLDELPVQRFAESLGLPGAPKVKFLNKEMKMKKNASRTAEAARNAALQEEEERIDSGESSEELPDEAAADDDGVTASTKKNGGVRTRYDRMFERKNQNVLSEHYSKLIDREPDEDGDDDFITLKRANHNLSDDERTTDLNGDLSKRKLKLGRAKRAVAKNGLAKKLVFDEKGDAHELYELAEADEVYKDKGGISGVQEEGRKFAEEERGKMRVTDVVDKQEARDKKREKKRKRKETEAGLVAYDDGTQAAQAELVPLSEDDGYVSPRFDLPDLHSDIDEESGPPLKRSKASKPQVRSKNGQSTLEDDEALALKLLRR